VLKLNKALYGLKQAPRSWNKMLVSYLDKQGFTQLKTDTCIFMNKQLIIAIYVDDIVVLGKTIEQITEFKNYISNKFKTKDLGHLKYILGITIEKLNNNTLIIHQKNYIEKIIKRFKYLDESKETEIPIQPNHNLTSDLRHENENLRKFIDSTKYREVIGSLIYLMTCSRPDISYSVGILSRYMQKPRELHWRYLKRLLRYIKTTIDFTLNYTKSEAEA
jgi:hypothetical protein